MTWSYDPSLSTDKDMVRLLIGDTDTNDQQVSDEAIAIWLIEANGNVYLAASYAAEVIAASYTRLMSVSIEGLSVQYSQRMTAYLTLATRLRARGSGMADGGAAVVTGVSWGEMASVGSDNDRAPTRVSIGFTDHGTNVDELKK